LCSTIETTDAVARIDGDEFAIILSDVTCELDLRTFAQGVLDRLAEPFSYKGHTLDCCASIGASLVPTNAPDTSDLLRQAGIALDVAKAKGRSGTVVYAPTMCADVEHRTRMLSNARGAITEGRITPYYQPKVWLGSGRLAGFEALLRWRNPHGHIEAPYVDGPRLARGFGHGLIGSLAVICPACEFGRI
jgi:predicted signal transduction protein with EAL and GGDEF domain